MGNFFWRGMEWNICGKCLFIYVFSEKRMWKIRHGQNFEKKKSSFSFWLMSLNNGEKITWMFESLESRLSDSLGNKLNWNNKSLWSKNKRWSLILRLLLTGSLILKLKDFVHVLLYMRIPLLKSKKNSLCLFSWVSFLKSLLKLFHFSFVVFLRKLISESKKYVKYIISNWIFLWWTLKALDRCLIAVKLQIRL